MTKFIDFNDLKRGQVVDNEFQADGVTVSAVGGSGKAMIFDTANPTGGDHDLESTNLGKALIISEDGKSNDPDDNANGGTFTFAFDTPAFINRLTFLDIEEGASVSFFAPNGHLIKTVHVSATDNNGQLIQDFDVNGVARMDVTLSGSGAIDNLVFDDAGPDGVVEGDNDANLIDAAYDEDPDGDFIDAGDAVLPGEAADDDIVDAFGGDDTVLSGAADDDVYAGSGDDSVEGGAGDDLIFGDSNYSGPGAGATTRESFEWVRAGFADDEEVSGFTQDTGNVDVTFSILRETGDTETAFSKDKQNVANIDDDGSNPNTRSSLESVLNGKGNDGDYALDFSAPVEEVSFRVNDIDGDGVVKISAFDADGNPIVVNLEGGSRLTLSDTDGVDGNDTANSNEGYLPDTSSEYSLLVSIPGPVSRIVIEHDQDGSDNSGINVTDVYFDAPVIDNGEAGNDTLNGGAGDDTIFGEDGDDVINGGEDDDSLDGGDGDDTLDGGEGDDDIFGGADRDTIFADGGDTVDGGAGGFDANPGDNTDDDTLDLTGQGPFFLEDVTPDANGNGINGTVVFVDDAGNPTGQTITFTEIENIVGEEVNRGPDAVDDTINVDEDGEVTFDPTANDTDPDGDPLEIESFTQPDNGTVTENPDGTLTYTPDPDYNGPDSFEVTITDPDGATSTSTVNVNVAPVNDAPDAVNDVAETDEETPVTIDALNNDTDVDGDDLTITAASVPSEQGTVEIVDNKLVFTPATDFTGQATISYSIEDGNGGTDVAEVAVTVNNVNDGPVAVDDIAETDEDTPVTIDVLENDTDADGDDLTITDASVPAEQGTVEIVDNKLLFTPAQDFNGPATITYTIEDGNGGSDTGEALVNVGAVNDGPTAVDDTETTDEDTPVTIDVLGNDTDPDGDDLEITVASVPADEGTVEIVNNELVFTPAENFNGDATIDYSITDGNGGTSSAQVLVTVNPVNDDPVAVDDIETTDEDVAVVVDLLGNDSDVDGDDLTISALSVDPAEGSVVDNGDGTVTFTPAPNFNGPATISYTVSDGNGGTDEGEAVVSVGAVNDSPIAEDDTATTDEDTPVTIDVLDNDSDPDGDPLNVVSATVPADQGTVEIVDNELVFTPAPDFNGEATITYTITDGNGLNDTADVVVTVNPVGDDIVAVDDVAETDEDTPVEIDVLANDENPDGDDLTVTDATSPDGTVDINPDGTITFTPTENFNGDTTITYTVEDPDGNEDTATVNVTVNPVNDAPTAVDDSDTTPFNTPVTVDVLNNDFDVDGDDIEVVAASSPDGTVDIDDDGTITFTPTPGFEGVATVSYTIEDEEGLQDTAEVLITVEDDPRDGIVSNGDEGALIDQDYDGDPDGDFVDNDDAILPGEGPNDDIIQAGGGNDTIVAGIGDDDVFAGTGDDQVHGGPGNDILRGEDGEDSINGGAGDDTIDGGDDDDVINGGDGSDSILGGEGNDSITSSDPDNDLLVDKGYPGLFPGEEGTPEAENERDFVDGGAGDDTISTGDDRDTIVGGTGDDVIDGGIDDDVIDGDDTTNPTEGGADRIVGGEGNDLIDGGVGNDTIYAGNDPDLGLDILNIEDDGSNPFGPDLRPDNGRDTVSGGEGDDVIFGADDDDELFGDEGDDTIDGEIDDDLVDGGVGDDSLRGGQGDDTVVGGDGQDTIDGGIGADDLSGGADEDLFVNVNAGDTVDGGSEVTTGTDFDTLDLRGSAPTGGSLTVEITGPDSNGNGFDGVVNFFDEDGNDAGTLTFTEIEDIIPCFTPGTMIATASGECLVQNLKVGDRVITRDNGIQEVRWVGKRDMSGLELDRAAHLRPVLIRQGALGKGLPERDMLVSPQHRVLMASDKTALYFDEAEVLVAAKHLTDMDGIDVVEVSGTTYIHVLFDQHEVILSDGAWSESFQPGDQTLNAMSDAVRAEILELFPELETEMGIKAYAAARRSLKKHEAKLLSQ